MITYGGRDRLDMLQDPISDVWHDCAVPETGRRLLKCPYLEKGDPFKIDNYRGISLLSLPGKVYAILLKHRLRNWLKSC